MGVLPGSNLDDVVSVDRQNAGSVPDGATAAGGSGPAGPPGPPGTGIPSGGSINQRLAKLSAAAYATKWVPPDYYNVYDYGVVGNGVADDTANLQACITAAGATGGVVLVGPGSFLVSSSLTIPTPNQSIIIRGCGGRASWFKPNGNFDLFTGGAANCNGFGFEDFGVYYSSQQTTTNLIKWTAGINLRIRGILAYYCGNFLTLGTDIAGSAFNFAWIEDCNISSQGGIVFNFLGSMGDIYIRGISAVCTPSLTTTQITAHTGTHTPGIDGFWMSECDFENFGKGMLWQYAVDGGIVDAYFDRIIIGNGITGSHAISVQTDTSTVGRSGDIVFSRVNANCGGSGNHALNLHNTGSGFGVAGVWVDGCNLGASSGDAIHVGTAEEIWVKNCMLNSSTNGFHATSTSGLVDVVANRIGYPGAGNTVGVLLDSGAAGGIVTNNDCRSNTTALTNNWGANSAGVRYVGNNFGVDI